MEVSDKLALEFNTIIVSHTLTLLLLVSFSAYVYFRARKSPLLYSYISVVGMIALWLIAKILKTVSPIIELRWFFIVLQYFAIDCLGICLIVFAHIFKHKALPTKKQLLLWSILPALAFFALVTNPIHMTFYTYFDIYKDSFGISFYLAQSVQYLYLLIGILQLSKGFIRQPGFGGKKGLGRLFAVFVLLPLLANAYYILFKLNLVSWVFPFPVFDFTPIAASISLILFVIPTMTFRFFDIAPISLNKLYDIVPQGLVLLDEDQRIHGGNRTFLCMLQLAKLPKTLDQLISHAKNLTDEGLAQLSDLVAKPELSEAEITMTDGRFLKLQKRMQKNGLFLLCFSDTTEINQNRFLLANQNQELEQVNSRLRELANTTKSLAIARTKTQMAQNVHDILGHSLTVVIGTAELAAKDDEQQAFEKLGQIEELLTSSLSDIKNALHGNGMKFGKTTLTKALEHLNNERISVDIQINGQAYELNSRQTEAIYRLCQEAVTNAIWHGKAQKIYLVLRFQPQQIEVYAVDNGVGCKNICEGFGLLGMKTRFEALSGSVSFASDGESGFTIHAVLPKQARC